MSDLNAVLTALGHASLPPSGLLLLIVLGLLIRVKWRRAGNLTAASSLFLLYFLSTGIGAHLLVAPLERMATPLTDPAATNAQAIVVLAAGRYAKAPEYGGKEIPDYIALARLRYAAHLHHASGLPVLVSGNNADAEKGFVPKATAMAEALEHDFRVPVRWIEQKSETTTENAIFSAQMLAADGVRRILLVTDAMHMPRAVGQFRAAGLEAVEAPTIFFSAAPMSIFHLFPTAENMRQSSYAAYQWLGMARDRLMPAQPLAHAVIGGGGNPQTTTINP